MSLDVDGAQLTFSRRLARDNGWGEDFSQRVIDEYKRFVYLAATAGHPVTPSDEVDQAWHLHLAYTSHYWDEMCGEILGQPLHHGPTQGGKDESAKYRDWYVRTLESYEAAFGEKPPADVWPPPERRFAGAEAFQRIDKRDYLLVPKPPTQAVVLGAIALILAGCSLDGEFGRIEVLLFIALVGVIIWIAITEFRKREDGTDGGGCGAPGDGGDGSGCGSGCGGGCGGCGG